jgi:hypothetical protein
MYNADGQCLQELSCLVASEAGKDLLCHLRSIQLADGLNRLQRLRITLSVFKAYVCFFKQAWDRGVYFGDYGLRQVSLRAGASPMQDVDVRQLVLVDVEHLMQTAEAKKIGRQWKKVWLELEANLVQQNYQLPSEALSTVMTLINAET